MIILACDPGNEKSGAMAYSLTSDWSNMNVMNMPKSRQELFKFFLDMREKGECRVYIEEQHVRPGDFKTGAAYRIIDNLIRNYHDLLFCCEVLDISHIKISAKEWQKKYKPLPLKYDKKKSALYHIAKRKYPGLKPRLRNADAILILEHGLIHRSYER